MANEKNDSEKVSPNISIIYSKELENSSKIIRLLCYYYLFNFQQNQISRNDRVLELWSKILEANQNVGIFKLKYLTNELRYEVEYLYVIRHP